MSYKPKSEHIIHAEMPDEYAIEESLAHTEPFFGDIDNDADLDMELIRNDEKETGALVSALKSPKVRHEEACRVHTFLRKVNSSLDKI